MCSWLDPAKTLADAHAMELTPALEAQLRTLVTDFLAENENINLSALRTEDACWNGNVLDSLPLLEVPDVLTNASSLLDVGAGGGFPLLPLALALPQMKCSGLDSIGKKMLAVQRIAKASGITNVITIADRAEAAAHKRDYREKYDIVTARAVAPLNQLLEYCAGFVKPQRYLVLWKSMHIDEELAASANAQKVLGCPLVSTHCYTLPGDWGKRQLLIFRKEKPLTKDYPREVGMAKKLPL